MSRVAIPVVFVFAVASVLLGLFLFGPTQDSGRTLSAGLASSTAENVCRAGARRADSSIVVVPSSPGADVHPIEQIVVNGHGTPRPTSQLSLSFVTFPPGSFDAMHSHIAGASIIYVERGTIEYMFEIRGNPSIGSVLHHRPGETGNGEEVLANTWRSVAAGEWITETARLAGRLCHALRNVTDEDVVITFTVYADSGTLVEHTCFGGCRTRGP